MVEHEKTSWIDWVSIGISRVAMFIVAFIVAIMFYEVVMRYVFEKPTLWVNEMSLWAAGAVYLLAGLYVMQQRGHIRIFILYDMVPRWAQRLFDLLSTLFIVLFAAAIVWGGTKEAWDKLLRWETFGTAWDPPIPATMKPLILITVVLIAIQAVANLIADWGKEKEVHDLTEEVAQEYVD
jgi:TRAP-type C4-dicarboxylate transport system permease small subunit